MKNEIENSKGQFLVYKAEDGAVKIDVKLSEETVWLTQKLMAELFHTSIPNINMHLKNIFSEGELKENSTIKDFLIVQKEGKRIGRSSEKQQVILIKPLNRSKAKKKRCQGIFFKGHTVNNNQHDNSSRNFFPARE